MEFVIDKLARRYQMMGHKPVVVAQRPRHNREIPQLPYDVIYYPRPRSAVWLLQYVEYVLKREHKRYGFDVIHAHLAYPNGYIACKIKDELNVPIVITSHKGDIIPESRYRQRPVTCKRMCWALANVNAATGVSSELKGIIDELSMGKANSHFVPNGVDIPEDNEGQIPESCTELAGRPFMLTLGRLHYYKGLDVLLEAMKLLKEKSGELPILIIAGDGREKGNLSQQVKDLGLIANVIFAGSVFGEQKHWLLRNCTFFLQPSRAEGMPLTVLEAMAYKKVVIGTKISGTIELIDDGVNGILVEPEDSQMLCDAIRNLVDTSDLTSLQKKAFDTASKLSWQTVAKRYLELYSKA
ncbi:MAG TPA: glycosyltransferase family 4 protein [Phycisphaerales bacterium]|nr:glycosyltransferase family 4 protein [Phycisphaerales bacterium]